MDIKEAIFLAILLVGCPPAVPGDVSTGDANPDLNNKASATKKAGLELGHKVEVTPTIGGRPGGNLTGLSEVVPTLKVVATKPLDVSTTITTTDVSTTITAAASSTTRVGASDTTITGMTTEDWMASTEDANNLTTIYANSRLADLAGTRQTILFLRKYKVIGSAKLSCRRREWERGTEYKNVVGLEKNGTNCGDNTKMDEIPTFPGSFSDNMLRYSFIEGYWPITHAPSKSDKINLFLGTLREEYYQDVARDVIEGFQVSNEQGHIMIITKSGGVLDSWRNFGNNEGIRNAIDDSLMPFSRLKGQNHWKLPDISPTRGSSKARITVKTIGGDQKIEKRYDANSESCGTQKASSICLVEGDVSPGFPFKADVEFAMSDHSIVRNFSVFNCNNALKIRDMKICDCPKRSVCYIKEGVKHVLTRLETCPGTFLGYKSIRFANIWHFMNTDDGAPKGTFVDPIAFTEFGLIEMNVQDPIMPYITNREFGGWTSVPMRWCADMNIGVVVENKEAVIRATIAEVGLFQEFSCNGLSVVKDEEEKFTVDLPFYQKSFSCAGRGFRHDVCLKNHPGPDLGASIGRDLCRNYSEDYVIWGILGPTIFFLGIPWAYMMIFWSLSKVSDKMQDLYCIMRVKQKLWVYKEGMTESEIMRVKNLLIRKKDKDGIPVTLQNGKDAIVESNALLDYIAEDHSKWYKFVCAMQIGLRPLYYLMILISYSMIFVMIIPAGVVAIAMSVKGDKTKTRKGKMRDWFVYILFLQMSVVQVRSERSKMFNFQPPEVNKVGTTIQFQEDCTSTECLASFIQNFPMVATPGYTITSGIEDSSGDVVGGITYKVESVDISSVMTYDYSIWTVTEAIANEITDGNDDCDGDNSEGWNCNQQSNLACLLYHNEFKAGMSAYHGSWKDLGDKGKSLYTPSSFGFVCPKGIWAAGTRPGDGQRYRVQWYPQNKESPVVRVYNIPVMTNIVTVSIEIIIGENKLKEEIQVDMLGIANDIDQHVSVNAVSWSSSDLSGERIGCLYSSSDATKPEICYTGFEGYQAKTKFIKAVGEMWGVDVEGKLVEGVPEFYNWPGQTYDWGGYYASVSSDFIASWTRTDIASLGSSIPDISGCTFNVEQIDKTQVVLDKEVCEIWGKNTDNCGGGGTVNIKTIKPRQAKITMNNCPKKNFELTTHIKEWPYKAQDAELEIIDPTIVTMSSAGCYDLNSMLEVSIRVPEGTKPGILLLQSGTVIMGSSIWLEDLVTVVNGTALNGDNLWIYGMTTKGDKITIYPTLVKMEVCETYSNPDDPNQTEEGIEGKSLKWWEIMLIVLGCLAGVILIALLTMCYCRHAMTKEASSSFTKFIVPTTGESKPEPKSERVKSFLKKRNGLRKARDERVSKELELEPLMSGSR